MMNGRNRLSWEETALNLAFDIAKYRSEDPYIQVGACVLKNDNSIILGYNGAPSGMSLDWSNRDKRRKWIFHAEANVLNRILPGETKLLAVTHMPCSDCLKIIKQKEIDVVYYKLELEQYDPGKVKQIANIYNIKLVKL
jgi:deoxycytidylate deaminase